MFFPLYEDDRMQRRAIQHELMDDPSLAPTIHRAALAGLSRLNRLSRSAAILWSAISDLISDSSRPLRILDIATGAGDLPIALERRARKSSAKLSISACDVSPVAIEAARSSAAFAESDVEFFQLDVLNTDLPGGYDVITCSLFLHHLTDAQAIGLVRAMAAAARRRIVVNDLARSYVNLVIVALASRLVTRCPVVHTDGPISVRAAFTIAEATELACSAGLANTVVAPRFPSRFLLTWNKE